MIQSQLKPWVQSWCDHGTAGGCWQHALMQIRKAMADEASCFVQLDIASFFDSIQLPILQRALQRLRFPPSVMSVLLDFYAGAERVFTLAGAHTPEWAAIDCAIDCGLAQGCPLSPVLASALSHLWASYVASDGHPCGVGALAYIDDRTLWLRKGCPVSCMRDALLRSAEFDCAFCFSLSLDKCSIIPRVPSKEHSALAEAFGFKQAEELEVLGVRAPFDGAWTVLRLRVCKVVLRVRLLGWATANRKIQKHGGAPFLLGCWLC